MFKQLHFLTSLFLLLTLSLHSQVAPTIVADGFVNSLIGLEVDADGNIWVCEMGTGNDDGSITIIAPDGTKTLFMTGLPSGFNPFNGELAGPYRTYHLENDKVMIVSGEGVHPQAEALLIVDKSTFTPGTPLTLADVEETIKIGTFVHNEGFVQSNPYHVEWDAEGDMYITDSGANSILKRDKDTGELSVVATLMPFTNPLPFGPPVVDPVPTKTLAKADGSFYVCQLTGFPFIEGAANVYNMDASGNLSVHADNFTCLTDMAYDPSDGNLCVMQFGVFGPVDTTLNFIIGTAAVIKLMPDGSRDTIAQGIGGLAPSLYFDANGDLYVTDLAFGQVLKYDFPTSTQDLPAVVASVRAFPNPFADHVRIEYELEKAAEIQLDIIGMDGRQVMHLDRGQEGAGVHFITWDGRVNGGQLAAPGTYVYRLQVDNRLVSGLIYFGGRR